MLDDRNRKEERSEAKAEQIQTLPPYPLEEVTIPEGHVWVEGKLTLINISLEQKSNFPSTPGDEPFWTLDSNTWGPVSFHSINPSALCSILAPGPYCPNRRKALIHPLAPGPHRCTQTRTNARYAEGEVERSA